MANIKNCDSQCGISYVAIRSEKKNYKIKWMKPVLSFISVLLISASVAFVVALMVIGA